MFGALRSHLTYANLTATLALFVALGGSSYAAVKLSKNSVRSGHIKNGQVKRADVARDAIDSARVRDAALFARDFAPGELPAGPKGDKGDRGDRGDKGDQGDRGSDAFGTLTFVRGPATALPTSEFATVKAVAVCPTGQRPVGGGVDNGEATTPAGSDATEYYVQMAYSHPRLTAGVPDGWVAGVSQRYATSNPYVVRAWAVCAPAAQITGP